MTQDVPNRRALIEMLEDLIRDSVDSFVSDSGFFCNIFGLFLVIPVSIKKRGEKG